MVMIKSVSKTESGRRNRTLMSASLCDIFIRLTILAIIVPSARSTASVTPLAGVFFTFILSAEKLAARMNSLFASVEFFSAIGNAPHHSGPWTGWNARRSPTSAPAGGLARSRPVACGFRVFRPPNRRVLNAGRIDKTSCPGPLTFHGPEEAHLVGGVERDDFD